MPEYFEVLSKLKRRIRTTKSYWIKIITLKHPVMAGKESQVKKTLADPDIVKESEKDKSVLLYYKKFAKRFVCAVVRHENGSGFIISCYPVDKIKKGKVIYKRSL